MHRFQARSVLLLLCSAGGQLYAMESRHVVEVIPRVHLRPVVNLPKPVAGVFSYRGMTVPVIDLCLLIHGEPSGGQLSSRIIMVSSRQEADQSQQILGLLSEGVTDTLSQSLSAFSDPGLSTDERSWLGGMYLDERGMVQLLHLEQLLRQLLQMQPLQEMVPG